MKVLRTHIHHRKSWRTCQRDWHNVDHPRVRVDLPVYQWQLVSIDPKRSAVFLPRHAGHKFAVSVG